MEIKINVEQLKEVLDQEVIKKLEEQEQTIEKLKYEYAKKDVITEVNDVFSFYYYFKDYVSTCNGEPSTKGFIEWRGNSEVWNVYFDLVQKHGLNVVNEIIYDNFIKKEVEELEKEEKEEE